MKCRIVRAVYKKTYLSFRFIASRSLYQNKQGFNNNLRFCVTKPSSRFSVLNSASSVTLKTRLGTAREDELTVGTLDVAVAFPRDVLGESGRGTGVNVLLHTATCVGNRPSSNFMCT